MAFYPFLVRVAVHGLAFGLVMEGLFESLASPGTQATLLTVVAALAFGLCLAIIESLGARKAGLPSWEEL
jgi:hypothetical protein